MLHEELDRLPDRYRTPLILCDLEGLTHEQAATRLGWPVGTVKSRQARGREQLRGRLVRRGLASSAGLALLALDHSRAIAQVTGAWADHTARAVLSAKTGALFGSPTTLLAQYVLKTMALTRFMRGALMLGLVGTTSAALWAAFGAAYTAVPPPSQTAPAAPDDKAAARRSSPAQRDQRPRNSGAFHIALAADWTHDLYATAQSLRADALKNTATGYAWVRYEDRGEAESQGLILRDQEAGPGRHYKVVLVKLDPRDATEQDLVAVHWTRDQIERPAVAYQLSADGAQRLAEITRPRLPQPGQEASARLVIAVHGTVVATPLVGARVTETGTIELGSHARPGEVRRLLAQLIVLPEGTDSLRTPRRVRDRAEEVRKALDVDLPIIECRTSAAIEATDTKARAVLDQPDELFAFRHLLMPQPEPSRPGEPVAVHQLLFATRPACHTGGLHVPGPGGPGVSCDAPPISVFDARRSAP